MKAFLRYVFPSVMCEGEISAIATVHKAGTGSRAIKLERFRWSNPSGFEDSQNLVFFVS